MKRFITPCWKLNRRAENRLRISVQLVNAAEGFQIWSERCDREMKDIFEHQDEITLSIIDQLKPKLLDTEKAVVLMRYTENAEAYELFLKGRCHAYKYTAEGDNLQDLADDPRIINLLQKMNLPE